MTRTVVGILGLLALLPALQAQDKPETLTPAQQYQTLEKEYQTAVKEFRNANTKLKKSEERQRFILEKNPQGQFAPRFLKLAEKNPKDPAAVDALIWIVSHVNFKNDPKNPRSKAIQILLCDHLQSEKMATLCQSPSIRSALDEDRRHLVSAVLAKSKYRPAQGQACFALAHQAETRLRSAQRLKERPEMAKSWQGSLGKETVEVLVNADVETLSKEAESLYKRVIKDFGDLIDSDNKKLSETAKEKLDELPYPILVGKPAPEIEGEDIDGKKFKLGDYRGKVVLLDFWGNW
jgi:hypothetical protein